MSMRFSCESYRKEPLDLLVQLGCSVVEGTYRLERGPSDLNLDGDQTTTRRRTLHPVHPDG